MELPCSPLWVAYPRTPRKRSPFRRSAHLQSRESFARVRIGKFPWSCWLLWIEDSTHIMDVVASIERHDLVPLHKLERFLVLLHIPLPLFNLLIRLLKFIQHVRFGLIEPCGRAVNRESLRGA